MARLRRADLSKPGYARERRRADEEWTYLDVDGRPLADAAALARVAALVLPPAWTDVWVCRDPLGHIQAVGTDARGRRQYRYHDLWRTRRDAAKFDHMTTFARALPDLRATVAEHLALPELSRERVLACAVRLLDLGFFRIGTEGYAEQNNTYGLATMKKRHVRLRDGEIAFDYVAKHGVRQLRTLVDPDCYEVLRQLKARRGGRDELLAHKAPRRGWADVRSADVNAYIKEATGEEFSAKDFRTWNATVLMAVALAVSTEAAASERARTRAVARAYKEVAEYLGNTPAVCRASYVDPRVVDRYRHGLTIAVALEELGEGRSYGEVAAHGPAEEAVLDLLDEAPLAKSA